MRAVRRDAGNRMRLPVGPTAALLVALTVTAPRAGLAAPEIPPWLAAPPEWMRALVRYTNGLDARGEALRALGRGDTTTVPPLYQLALADVQHRAGHSHAATRLYDEALARALPSPWDTWAQVNRAWLALRGGDVDAARAHFAAAAGAPDRGGTLGAVLLAWLDGARGAADAAERLQRLADAPDTPPPVALVAHLATGHAHLWAGRPEPAAAAFDATAALDPWGPLADDARYGAARARWAMGDVEEALTRLRRLSPLGVERGTVARALVDLAPRALITRVAARFRTLPPQPPEEQVVALFDEDGVTLAAAALRQLPDGPAPVRAATVTLRSTGDERKADAPARPSPPADRPVPPDAGATGHRWPVVVIAAVAALLAGRYARVARPR